MVLKAACIVIEQTLQGTNYTVAEVAADSLRRESLCVGWGKTWHFMIIWQCSSCGMGIGYTP